VRLASNLVCVQVDFMSKSKKKEQRVEKRLNGLKNHTNFELKGGL
jgi:hypothetical protein